MMTKTQTVERGLPLGIALILIAVALGVAVGGVGLGPLQNGFGTVLTGIYIYYVGLLFLLSFYFRHKTFLFRGLMWICSYFSVPRSENMAFVYAALAFVFGTVAVMDGLGIVR